MNQNRVIPTRLHARTGLDFTEIGFGASAIGNLGRVIDEQVARDTVHAALSASIRFLDTAPFYGRGLSERRLGDALRGRTAEGTVVSTKVGRLLEPDATIATGGEVDGFFSPMPFRVAPDYGRDAILRSFDASLHRTGLDHIDILFVHDIGRRHHGPRHDHHWRQLTAGGGFNALVSLREQGAIRAFGLGVNEVEVCLDALDATPVDLLLLANRYTLLEQTALDTLFPRCVEQGVGVIAGAPFSSGILATGTRGASPPIYDYAPAPPAIIDRVRGIEAVAEAWDVPLAAAALQFPLMQRCVVSVLPGIGDVRRVSQTIDLYRHAIPDGFWFDLLAQGLIRSDSFVPTATAKAP